MLGEVDLLQLILIDGLMGVGVPWCWCSLVTKGKKIVPQIVPPIMPKPPQKIMFFAEVLALLDVLFEVLLNSTLNSTTKVCDRMGLSVRVIFQSRSYNIRTPK